MEKYKICDLFDLQMGKTPSRATSQYWNNGDNDWVSIADLSSFEKFTGSTKETISNKAVSDSKIKIVPKGTVIMSFKLSLGKTCITSKDVYTNEAIMAFIPKFNNIVRADYLYYYLSSIDWNRAGNRAVMGTTLNKATLNSMTIEIPSIDEQIKVAKKLDKVVDLISKRKQQLEKLDELVKSRFIEMFGDPVMNQFGWQKKPLGEVCDVRDGTHDSPRYYEQGYPLVTSKNVTGGKIDLSECSLISRVDFEKINERSKVDKGDILMPMIGTVGKPVIVDIESKFAIKNVSLIKFKKVSEVINKYIKALLQSDYFASEVIDKIRGGTQKFISLGDIRKLMILVPPLDLQNQFAAFVEQVDKSKSEVKQALKKLETLKKALMQKYFG